MEQGGVSLEIQAQALQALLQPVVFSALLPKLCFTLPAAVEEDLSALTGDHLERTQEHELVVRVPQVQCASLWRLVDPLDFLPEVVREENCIGIGLDRPIVVLVAAIILDFLPSLDEGLDVVF